MDSSIRILCILEYRFDNIEVMQRQMANWVVGANSIRDFGSGTIRSAIMLPERFNQLLVKEVECALQEVIDCVDPGPGRTEAEAYLEALRVRGFEIVPRIV